MGLTPVGEDLLARAPALLDELDDLIGSVREESKGLSGLVRISAPVSFGEIYVGDMVRRFVGLHPQMNVDLRLSDAYVDLARDGIDLAFRIGTPSVSSLKMRKLGDMSSTLVASPDYIKKHGEPSVPQDLLDHICMVDSNRRDPTRWSSSKRASMPTLFSSVALSSTAPRSRGIGPWQEMPLPIARALLLPMIYQKGGSYHCCAAIRDSRPH